MQRRAGRLGAGNGGQTARGHTTAARHHLSAWHGRGAATTGRDARLQLSEPTHGLGAGLGAAGLSDPLARLSRFGWARGQNIFTDAVREQLEGRSQMGLLVYEVMRAVDYLLTRPELSRGFAY